MSWYIKSMSPDLLHADEQPRGRVYSVGSCAKVCEPGDLLSQAMYLNGAGRWIRVDWEGSRSPLPSPDVIAVGDSPDSYSPCRYVTLEWRP